MHPRAQKYRAEQEQRARNRAHFLSVCEELCRDPGYLTPDSVCAAIARRWPAEPIPRAACKLKLMYAAGYMTDTRSRLVQIDHRIYIKRDAPPHVAALAMRAEYPRRYRLLQLLESRGAAGSTATDAAQRLGERPHLIHADVAALFEKRWIKRGITRGAYVLARSIALPPLPDPFS